MAVVDTRANVIGSFSTSVAVNCAFKVVSSVAANSNEVITAASFTGLMVIFTVALAEAPGASATS